jgi:3-phosphoglycerate kinase
MARMIKYRTQCFYCANWFDKGQAFLQKSKRTVVLPVSKLLREKENKVKKEYVKKLMGMAAGAHQEGKSMDIGPCTFMQILTEYELMREALEDISNGTMSMYLTRQSIVPDHIRTACVALEEIGND